MAFSNRSILVACARTLIVVVACCNLGAGPFTPGTIDYVAELFTSQGCSSCPPADQWLAAIAHKPGVVAVSFHVDYWDYIGWQDTLASPAFTARQRAYAEAHGEGQVYTPQVMVNGLAGVAGSDRAEIEQAIKMTKGVDGAVTVPMRLTETGGHFMVEVTKGAGGPASVFALRVARASAILIPHGENAGRSVTYTNFVRAMAAGRHSCRREDRGTLRQKAAKKRYSSPRRSSLRTSKFPAIGRYDAFPPPRSRHIEEAKQHPFSAPGGQEYQSAMSRQIFPGFPAVPTLALAFASALACAGPASAKTKPAPKAEQSGAASADTTKTGKLSQLASYGDWGVFLAQSDKSKTCYALATPKDRAPAGLKRDPAYIFISNRPGENVREEISVIMGFPMKEGGGRAEIAGSRFDLIVAGANAWIKNQAEEATFVDALKKGSKLIVKAPSLKGHVTTDTYSLTGLAQALERVEKECP
jgi:invasion protein IalB